MITQRRQHRGRVMLVVVLATCWALGWLGLDGGRASAFQLFVFVTLTAIVTTGVAAMRRRVVAGGREHVLPPVRIEPRNCIVIRPLGETSEDLFGRR